jgi:DNA-binding NarL/FixJ family response regulator
MKNNELIKHKADLVKHVGYTVNITNKLISVDLRILNILHLDDHLLYASGISICIKKKFPNVIIKNIQNGDEALKYVSFCMNNKHTLDLIITDINHPGLNGLDFANAVRLIEKDFINNIPIIFITMVDDQSIVTKFEKIPFTKHLIKTSPCEEINLAIQNFV